MLASFVAFLDGTVVNVALPAISRELGGGLITQQWVVDAYLITLGALILRRRIGERRVRPHPRAAHRARSASASPRSRSPRRPTRCSSSSPGRCRARRARSSCRARSPSSPRRSAAPLQGRAIGLWTAMTTGAMVAGPLIGGLFVDFLSWRFAFLINVVPIAHHPLAAAPPRPRDDAPTRRARSTGSARSCAPSVSARRCSR